MLAPLEFIWPLSRFWSGRRTAATSIPIGFRTGTVRGAPLFLDRAFEFEFEFARQALVWISPIATGGGVQVHSVQSWASDDVPCGDSDTNPQWPVRKLGAKCWLPHVVTGNRYTFQWVWSINCYSNAANLHWAIWRKCETLQRTREHPFHAVLNLFRFLLFTWIVRRGLLLVFICFGF